MATDGEQDIFDTDIDNDEDDERGGGREEGTDPVVWTTERLSRASYKDLGTPTEVEERFLRHLLHSRTCRQNLRNLYECEMSATTRDYSLEVDAFELLNKDPILGCLTLKYPSTLLPLLESAIVKAQKNPTVVSHERIHDGYLKGTKQSGIVTRVHARLIHLPPMCTKTSLHSMEANDVGKIWQVTGTVVRATQVQMYESARMYKCSGKSGCGKSFLVDADLEQTNNALTEPDRCPLVSDQTGERCLNNKLKAEPDANIHTDYQEIKIQDQASRLGIGTIPKSLLIKLQHDLVDICQPGDEVVVVGTLLSQWPQSTPVDVDCPVGMCLKAHSIRVVQEKGGSIWNEESLGEMERLRKDFEEYWALPEHREKPIAARDFICQAVCPKLYGMSMIKLALLVTLIGGVPSASSTEIVDVNLKHSATNGFESDDNEPDQFHIAQCSTRPRSNDHTYFDEQTSPPSRSSRKQRSVNTRRRDQSHMLLVGDPGTGKSQFLRFAAALCPRSVLTTGVGTTSAGLTCAAVREGSGKEFILEAGALVLADKGVCCIDEFGCIRKEDRTTIHEAMEQQTLSVAKAGIVCKLNCRATIIAVMNPKDCLYDNNATLSRNTGLGTPLLSRFDLIFKLVDTSDASRDSNITTYLLNRAIQGAGYECVEDYDADDEDGKMKLNQPWQMDKLRAYISIVKDQFNPVLSDAAALLLEKHYEKCRLTENTTLPVTVRFLESMIRLSQAHARLMYRNVVTLDDAVAVVRIMESSAFAYGGFDGNNADDAHNVLYTDPMTTDFCGDTADRDFWVFEYKILERYGMIDQMSSDKKTKALEYMGGQDEHLSDWGQVENVRDVQNHVYQDHYGRYHFPPGPPNFAAKRQRTDGW